MLFIDLPNLCRLKGIDQPYAFLRANGFTHDMAHRLSNGTAKGIKFIHLERLCRAFHCLPHDLFNYERASKARFPAGDILEPLRKKPSSGPSLNSIIRDLTPEQLGSLTTELSERFVRPSPQPSGASAHASSTDHHPDADPKVNESHP